jgi:hypothetical protein
MLEDQPTQQLLGLMLDALEAPTKKSVQKAVDGVQ